MYLVKNNRLSISIDKVMMFYFRITDFNIILEFPFIAIQYKRRII